MDRGVEFKPKGMLARIDKFWSLGGPFGLERGALDVFVNELVSDRYALVNGLQIIRDELQFASTGVSSGSSVEACGADFALPSVVTTIAHTNCGDRVHQGESMATYDRVVAARFATLSEIGELKTEKFSPTGGGVDDGATLAHVTVAHQLDEPLRKLIYSNPFSCVLVGIDLMTHVGRLDEGGITTFGTTRESPWREPRAACGAIAGMLSAYNAENAIHRRLRRDLGEENFAHLVRNKVKAEDGTDLTAVVAAAIVAIQGMRNVLRGLASEMDERGIAHVTASLTVNRVAEMDTVIYLARSTMFGGEFRTQGLGTRAHRYRGRLVDGGDGDRRLELIYDDTDGSAVPVRSEKYPVRGSETRAPAPNRPALESHEDLPAIGKTLLDLKPQPRPKPPRPKTGQWGRPPK